MMEDGGENKKKNPAFLTVLPFLVAAAVLLASLFLIKSGIGDSVKNEVPKVTDEAEDESDDTLPEEITGEDLEEIESPTGGNEVKTETAKPLSVRNAIKPVKCWIRAHISYQHERGIDRLDDSRIHFSSLLWKKADDGWYYYQNEVRSGDVVPFIQGVMIPFQWTNDVKNKEFSIKITVEAAEAKQGDAGWNENSEVAYCAIYDLLNTSGKRQQLTEPIRTGHMTVTLNEWQRDDEDGRIYKYENDKVIVPGAYISKIVEFTLHKDLIRSTGDAAAIFMYATILVLAAILLISVVYHQRKRRCQGEK